MTKAAELREMSDEQLGLTLKDTCEHFFRLRIQAQTERLDAPSELKKNRRLIARIKTIQRERAGGRGKSQNDAPTKSGQQEAASGADVD